MFKCASSYLLPNMSAWVCMSDQKPEDQGIARTRQSHTAAMHAPILSDRWHI